MSRILHANVGVVDPVFPYVPNDFGFPADGDETPFLRNLICRIAGIDRSAYVRADSMNGTLQLEGRDDLSFELIDLTDSYRPQLAEPVEITSNTNLLFRGHIVQCPEHYEINEDRSVRHINVRCMGAGHALDRRLVFGNIPGNDLYGVLIQILQPSGIHSDIWGFYDFAPFPGPQIDAQRVNGSTALQYVQRAVNTAGEGWTWWLDWNGNYPQLHVRDLSTDPIDAPWDATDDSGNILEVESVDRDDSEYANRVYVRMGSEAVSTITERFTGGTFAEDIYALDYVPLEMISITIDDVPQTFGIKSELWDSGDDLTKEWYYQPIGTEADWFANTLWRGPEQAAVGVGEVIEVTYRAQTGSYVRADDTAQQAARAALMGYGSGVVEKILEVKDIASAEAAQEYADAMLDKLKTVPIVVRYTTFRHGLKPGQTQTITLAKHGINGEFNISSVRFREVPNSFDGSEVGIEYAIEATSGTRAVPHPLRLHEDIIDVVRGAQEAAQAASAAVASAGTGTLHREPLKGIVDGTNRTFYTTYLPEDPPGVQVSAGGRVMNDFAGDFVLTASEGKIVYASGLQPRVRTDGTPEDHHCLYVRKGAGPGIGNPALGARKFAGGTDAIDYGNNAAWLLQGDMTAAVWLKLASNAVDIGMIISYGRASAAQDANRPFTLMTTGASGAWQIKYQHESGPDETNEVTLTFDTSEHFPNNEWRLLVIVRDATAKTVSVSLGNVSAMLVTDTQSYGANPDGGGSASNTLALGIQSGGATAKVAAFKGIIGDHYLWSRKLTTPEITALRSGSPPPSGIVLSVPVLGASPEVDTSPTGGSGTVTGTEIVAPRI